MAGPLQSESFALDHLSQGEPSCLGLKLTAKRYTMADSADNVEGLTLICTHAVGSHKEQWEPTLQNMFNLQQLKDSSHRIREIWSFDWPNHGEAAVINREALAHRPDGVSIYEWGDLLAEFLQSPQMVGHRIIALGHSAGTAALMLSTRLFPVSQVPYIAMILVESTIMTWENFLEHMDFRMAIMNRTVSSTYTRRTKWQSREIAFDWFSKRIPWKSWDRRVLRLLTEYGLEDAPDGVALKTDKYQEAATYPDVDGHFESATLISRICYAVPIHVIWGDKSEMIPKLTQDSLSDTREGRIVSSVTRLKGAGHMLVQENPELLGQSICQILDLIQPSHFEKSRL